MSHSQVARSEVANFYRI